MGLTEKDWSGVEGHRFNEGRIPLQSLFHSCVRIDAGGLTCLYQQERRIAKDWMLAYIHTAQVDSDSGCSLNEGSFVVDDRGERWNVIAFVFPCGFSEFNVISDHCLIRTCIGEKNCGFAI